MSDELKSVYDDFFGNEPENHKSDERALKKAREALDEAYRRFGSADLPGYKGPEDTASGSPEKAERTLRRQKPGQRRMQRRTRRNRRAILKRT